MKINQKVSKLELWANLEVAVGLGSIIVGILLMVAPGTVIFDGYNATIANAFFGPPEPTGEVQKLNHWLLATCGAGVVGWGIAWATIAHIPFRAGERWAWRCLMVSLNVWVALDVICALWFGVLGEVIFVTIALILGLIPLVMSAKYF